MHDQVGAIRGLWRNKRQLTFSTLNLAMTVLSALMMWKGVMAFTGSESPVVVVLSGSMEPSFQRGDILFLDNRGAELGVGDIVVFKIAGRDIPIVHRVLRAQLPTEGNGNTTYLTKGDNNNIDDRNLYAPGQLWLTRGEVLGVARAYIPYLGMVTILLNDYPSLKYVLLGTMGLFVLTGRET